MRIRHPRRESPLLSCARADFAAGCRAGKAPYERCSLTARPSAETLPSYPNLEILHQGLRHVTWRLTAPSLPLLLS